MFDIGWTEMLVLGVIALLVLGPRELPNLLRTLGRYVRQMRDVASEFRGQLDDISSEIDTRAQLKKLADEDLNIAPPDLFAGKKDKEEDRRG